MLTSLKSINLALAFFLELAMLAAFAYWGFRVGNSTIVKIGLGIGVPLFAAVVWGFFMAPTSTRRLQGDAYLAVKIALFLLAVAALIVAGKPVPGILLAVFFMINTILLYLWRQ